MNTLRQCFSWVLVGAVLGLGLPGAPARAELVNTETVIEQTLASGPREHVKALIQRPELAQQLQALGIEPVQAQARVDAMTDAEVQALADKLDTLPAGGALSNNDLIVILLLIIIVLLVV